jgi:flagellar basal body rod protein FlgG
MQTQQKNLDVIANNISNSQTNGFKRSYMTFRTTVSNEEEVQNVTDKHLPGDNGAAIAGIRRDLGVGPIVNTGNLTDYAMTGSGFFSVTDADGNLMLTRDGSFRYNEAGVLVDSQGRTVNLDTTLGTDITEQLILYDVEEIYLEAQGDNYFTLKEDAAFTTSQDDQTLFLRPIQGAIETSNVDLGEELTNMIVSHRAYSMSAKVFEVSDEVSDMINNVDR